MHAVYRDSCFWGSDAPVIDADQLDEVSMGRDVASWFSASVKPFLIEHCSPSGLLHLTRKYHGFVSRDLSAKLAPPSQ